MSATIIFTPETPVATPAPSSHQRWQRLSAQSPNGRLSDFQLDCRLMYAESLNVLSRLPHGITRNTLRCHLAFAYCGEAQLDWVIRDMQLHGEIFFSDNDDRIYLNR